MKSSTYFWTISLAILFTGCLEEIKLKDQRFTTQTALIQGRLIKANPSIAEISLRRIGVFENSEINIHVRGAKVFLFNDRGASVELKEEQFQERYVAFIPANDPAFPVEFGRLYHIEARLPDGGHYASEPELLLPVPKMEDIGYEIFKRTRQTPSGTVIIEDYIRFNVTTPLRANETAERSRLRWQVFDVYRLTDNRNRTCYNFQELRIDQNFIYNAEVFRADRLDRFALAETPFDFRFAEGFYLTVIQESLSKGAFVYWDQVQTLANRSGNMFDPPPGKIRSNIKDVKNPGEDAYGYFYATQHDTLRRYIRPEEVGSPPRYCPILPQPRPTVCDSCLLNASSTRTRPTFWIE